LLCKKSTPFAYIPALKDGALRSHPVTVIRVPDRDGMIWMSNRGVDGAPLGVKIRKDHLKRAIHLASDEGSEASEKALGAIYQSSPAIRYVWSATGINKDGCFVRNGKIGVSHEITETVPDHIREKVFKWIRKNEASGIMMYRMTTHAAEQLASRFSTPQGDFLRALYWDGLDIFLDSKGYASRLVWLPEEGTGALAVVSDNTSSVVTVIRVPDRDGMIWMSNRGVDGAPLGVKIRKDHLKRAIHLASDEGSEASEKALGAIYQSSPAIRYVWSATGINKDGRFVRNGKIGVSHEIIETVPDHIREKVFKWISKNEASGVIVYLLETTFGEISGIAKSWENFCENEA
jgi:hypothetical protein